ncbi:MAG TPA: Mov34/MPN/PAD-1 family protein [Kofleriaceae bacterium]|nr:Mov34/MPN/PAD-1 family protein [Kofleriaceae bacterium]
MTAIAIPDGVLAAIYAHAVATFPDECCGYLVGAAPGAVDEAVACRNAQADGLHPIAPERGADTGFVIAGAELLAFARSFDTDHPARIVYHSHTSGAAYLSAIDRQMAAGPAGPAYPVQHVVIGIALPAGAAGPAVTEVAQFAWSDAARDHVEVARWTPAGAPPGASP